MNTNTPIESQVLHEFKSSHIEELQQIAQSLVKITNLSEATVKSHLDAMLEQLVKSKVERSLADATLAPLGDRFTIAVGTKSQRKKR